MSNKTMAAAALSLFIGVAVAGHQAEPSLPDALDGVDVVVLAKQGKEVFGKSAFRSTHERFAYLFVSAENKAEFDGAPEKYAVQMGGLCARMGGTVLGNPSDYVLHEGRIYVFGSDTCRKLFIESPSKYIPREAAPWPAADGGAKGKVLLEKAAAAHGGTRLDAATSYTESSITIQKRPSGDVSIVTKNIWKFPGSVRSERTVPLAQGPQTFSTIITPAEVWGSGQGRHSPAPATLVPAIRANAFRALVPILKMRRDAGVRIAAAGPESIGGVPVERVRVATGSMDVILNIDPATGRVHSMSYYDRADQGAWGDIVIAFDDYRTVDGILVPFRETASANGVPLPNLTRTLDSAAFNTPLDPSLFVMPRGEK